MGKFAILVYVTGKTEVIVLVVSICLHKTLAKATSSSEQIKIPYPSAL